MKKDNSKKVKLIVIIGIILIATAIFSFMVKSDNNYVLKSEYNMGEMGYLDDIEVTLKDATYINKGTGIKVTFRITNKRDNTITITPDDYFVFYDINKVQIPNKYSNDKNIIKKEQYSQCS